MDTVPFLRLPLALTGFPRANPTGNEYGSGYVSAPAAAEGAVSCRDGFLILHNQRRSMVVDMGSTLQLPLPLVG